MPFVVCGNGKSYASSREFQAAERLISSGDALIAILKTPSIGFRLLDVNQQHRSSTTDVVIPTYDGIHGAA